MLSFNKLFKLLFLLFLIEISFTLNLNDISSDITEMSIYLQYLNNNILVNKTSHLSVVKSVRNKRANYFLNELLDEFSKTTNNVKLIIKNVDHSYKHRFSYVNFILIDSYESFEKINAGPPTMTEDFSEYYVIIYYSIHENAENEIQKIFDYCWQFYTVNVVLLLKTVKEGPINVYTYYPFSQRSCKTAQMRLISESKSVLQLKAADIFPNKFTKFFNCTLMAALWNVTPYLTLPAPESSVKKLAGIEGYLLNVLSEVLEFKIDYIVPPNNEQRGLVKANAKLTGALKMLSDRTADLSLGSFRRTLQRSTLLSPSYTFYQTMQVFTVLALHQPWSSLEVVGYPFQFHIWIILMVLIVLLLCSPLILKFYFPSALKFIYGLSSIYLIISNTVAITLNQTALFLPKRNFARYTLMMWILLTMILRSIYQGALYDFLTTQQNLAPPNTASDLIRLKYKLIVNVATNDSFSGVAIIRDKLIEVLIMNLTDGGGFPLLETNPDKHYVTGTPKDFLTYYVNTHNKNDVFHVLKETIFAQHLCIYFTKHSYLVKAFDQVLKNLQSFGLIDYWAKRFVDDRFLESDNGDRERQKIPFSLTQLSGFIKICLGLYLVAIIVFICEIVWFKINK